MQPCRCSYADIALQIWLDSAETASQLRVNCGAAPCKNWKALKFKEKWVFFVDFERKMVK